MADARPFDIFEKIKIKFKGLLIIEMEMKIKL